MNRLLIVLLAAACTSKSAAPPEPAPKTNGVEGHGGVAAAPVEVPHPTKAAAPEMPAADVEDFFQRAYMLKDSSPEEASRLFELVVKNSPVESAFHQRAVVYLEMLRRR